MGPLGPFFVGQRWGLSYPRRGSQNSPGDCFARGAAEAVGQKHALSIFLQIPPLLPIFSKSIKALQAARKRSYGAFLPSGNP